MSAPKQTLITRLRYCYRFQWSHFDVREELMNASETLWDQLQESIVSVFQLLVVILLIPVIPIAWFWRLFIRPFLCAIRMRIGVEEAIERTKTQTS